MEVKFKGYKLNFELHAAHANLQYAPDTHHFHTFSIVLWVKKHLDNLEEFDDLEPTIHTFLKPYENTYLGEHALFENSDLTVESIGDIFYRELVSIIEQKQFDLLRLDIWENPVRQFSVTKYRMDMNIQPLNISMLLSSRQGKIFEENTKQLTPQIQDVQKRSGKIVVATMPSYPRKEVNIEKKAVKIKYHLRIRWKILFALLCFTLVASVTYSWIYGSMISLYGSDTLCHLYRSDYIVAQIQLGNLFPLYDPAWYNGVEVMRYWGPLPLYILALLQFISGGTSLDAYMILIGVLIFVSGIGWLRFGIRYKHIALSIFIGSIWFFLPENTRLFVMDGNIPRVLINAILPFLLYDCWMFVNEKKRGKSISILILMSLCIIAHLGIAAMVLVSIALVALCNMWMHKVRKETLQLLGLLVLPFLICGLWSVPALQGGGAAKGSASNQVMAMFFAPLGDALNPLPHIQSNLGAFYIGLSVFVICIVGLVMGSKKVRPAFITALILFICTSTSVYEIFLHLPFSQFLWMIRFVPIALGIAMMGILLWDHLRKWVSILFCIMLLLDVLPSFQFLMKFKYQDANYTMQYSENLALSEGLIDGKSFTKQRLAVMELSGYGAFAPYYVAGVAPKTTYTFGAGWEGAGTSENIVALNTALEYGHYAFVFDRQLELGSDTIVFPIAYLRKGKQDIEALSKAGEQAGYKKVLENEKNVIFQYPVTSTFGIKQSYPYLAIGGGASNISLLFPEFDCGDSTQIDTYTFEELSKYKKLYLTDFTYENREAAEALLVKLSESGVEVYIDMNKIPVDPNTRKQELLGVSTQSIQFSDRFPDMNYLDEVYRTQLFDQSETTWNAVSLSGLDNVSGSIEKDNKNFTFAGTSKNDNLHFLGFNIVYHTVLTNDEQVYTILEDIFNIERNSLIKREIIPLDISFESDRITIRSEYDDVNTTIASLDIMQNDTIYTKNNLVYVKKGVTIISLNYPHLKLGLGVSLFGLLASAGLLYLIYRKGEKQ